MIFDIEKWKETRKSIRYSQDDIARISGVSPNIIKNIDAGRKKVTLDDEVFITVCEALNLNPIDFFKKKCYSIAFFNNKGGVTKSTSMCAIADIMAKEYGLKTLSIDVDPQSNYTQNLNMHLINNYNDRNIFKAFIRQESVTNGYIFNTGYKDVDIVVSHLDLSTLEGMLPTLPFREERFNNIIREAKESSEYDFILVDLPPNLGILNSIVLRSVDYVIIPVLCEPFSLAGLGTVLDSIEQINNENKMMNNSHRVEVLGILIANYDKRLSMSKAIASVIEQLYGNLLFKTKIGIDTSVTKAQANKEMLSVNFSNSNAYNSYTKLVGEILNDIKEK